MRLCVSLLNLHVLYGIPGRFPPLPGSCPLLCDFGTSGNFIHVPRRTGRSQKGKREGSREAGHERGKKSIEEEEKERGGSTEADRRDG